MSEQFAICIHSIATSDDQGELGLRSQNWISFSQEALATPPQLWLYFFCIACQRLLFVRVFLSFLFFYGLKVWGGFTMSSESTGKFQTPGALYAAFVKAMILDVPLALRLVSEAAFRMGWSHRRVRGLRF
jgi:hypothetical protein